MTDYIKKITTLDFFGIRRESVESPDTDAIAAGTLEWTEYRGKWLVRYRDASGSVQRVITASWNEANQAFEKFLADMRKNSGKQEGS